MSFASAEAAWLEPPDDDPICEECGACLEHDYEDYYCPNKFCSNKFQGVEQEMAIRILELEDQLETRERTIKRLRYKYEPN